MHNHLADTAFLDRAIRSLAGFSSPPETRVLDFGCGAGESVFDLIDRGFDAYGCDISETWLDVPSAVRERLSPISTAPYELPFEDEDFDVVISQSVFEHAQNKVECFQEIHRILKPNGYAMHLYPSKWYLPSEPHIYIPLVNYFWPNCPRWWLGLWALLGVRNEFQRDLRWREVLDMNERYCDQGLSYWSNRRYRSLSLRIFGNCSWPMRFYVDHSRGKVAAVLRKLPFRRFSGWMAGQFRMSFMVQKKMA